VPYAVTVQASAPIVVGRSVEARGSAAFPQWGASSGTVTTAARWVVPGPGVVHAPGTAGAVIDSLAVADPGPSAVRVSVAVLGGTGPLVTVTVAPGELMVLGPAQIKALVPLVVTASGPVVLEEDSGPSGSPGVVSSTGFPFPG
jgi:hypothetical protein